MSFSSLFLFSLLLLSIQGNQLILRTPGDLIWSKCDNIQIPTPPINVGLTCLNLTEAQNCGVAINVSISGRPIFGKELDNGLAPQVCGRFNFTQSGLLAQCDLCVTLTANTTDSTQQCLKAQTKCQIPNLPPISLPDYDAGCFTSEKLNQLIACKAQQCPSKNNQICSGQGTCSSGKCTCSPGWFGSDCSMNSVLFERCNKLSQISGNICVRISFSECSIHLSIVVQSGVFEQTIYQRDVPIRQFNTVFRQEMSANYLGCNVSLKWSNLEISETIVRGCGTASITCGGLPIASYPIDCFEDDQVLPACLGTCINDCSGHGTCDKGICHCISNYGGEDCSTLQCTNNCNGQGTCTANGCTCKSGYTGDDCSISLPNNSSSGGVNPAIIIVPLVLIAVVIAVVAFVYFYRKRKQAPRFDHFDLLDQDENDIALRESD